jgi:release factor glutamine methyltransferase
VTTTARIDPGREETRVWSVLDLLRWTQQHFAARGIETARLDAECLLAHALGMERLALYVGFDRPVDAAERARFRELVRRRAAERVPVSQLTGRKEFWSLQLAVTKDVLTPRPETETLVQAALELLPEGEAESRVLEIGTGSGAIALALAKERPGARITATDISPAALAVARQNAAALGLEGRIELREGSLYQPANGERFDLVVSNPPYLGETERSGLPPELAHEPEAALFAGADGLDLLRELVAGAPDRLRPRGVLALELAPGQADQVADWCRAAGLHSVKTHRDLAGRVRAVTARGEG